MKRKNIEHFAGNKGFTIIEVLVAMTILALFIMAFSALFVQSYSGIMAAGNKSKASYDAQADVEQRIAEKNSNAAQNFKIDFGSLESIEIKGGVVSTVKTKNGQSSAMDSFLALIPTMIMKPYLYGGSSDNEIELYEDYSIPQPIEIIGSDTHFSGSSVLSITDKNGFSVTGSTMHVNSAVSAEISLAAGLTNSAGPYLITIRTGTEYVSAKLIIKPLIRYAVIGDNGVIAVSTNATNWIAEEWGIDIPENDLNCVTSHNGKFVTVGDAGIVIYSSNDGRVWTSVNLGPTETITNFRSIIWGNNKYVAVGTGGTIYTLEENLSTRSCVVPGSSISLSDLNSVAFGEDNLGNDKFVAVGAAGTITVSSDGTTWSKITPTTAGLPEGLLGILPDFNAITWGRIGEQNWFVAVGDSGVVAFSKDAINWFYGIATGVDGNVEMPTIQYNSVVCANNRIIAAGETSVLLIDSVSEETGSSITAIRTTGSITDYSQAVDSVVHSNGKYWAIFNGDTLFQSTDGGTWYNTGKIGTAKGMNSLCVR